MNRHMWNDLHYKTVIGIWRLLYIQANGQTKTGTCAWGGCREVETSIKYTRVAHHRQTTYACNKPKVFIPIFESACRPSMTINSKFQQGPCSRGLSLSHWTFLLSDHVILYHAVVCNITQETYTTCYKKTNQGKIPQKHTNTSGPYNQGYGRPHHTSQESRIPQHSRRQATRSFCYSYVWRSFPDWKHEHTNWMCNL